MIRIVTDVPARSISRGRLRELWTFGSALMEAAIIHLGISAALPFARFETLARAASRTRRRQRISRLPANLCRAVALASRCMPVRSVCLHRGLTLHTMLRRRGFASLLHYGIAPPAQGFGAHVWVTLDGRILIGEDGLAGMKEVAVFPRERP